MKNILPLLLLIAVFTSCVKDRSSIPSGASVKSLVLKADTVTTTDSLRLGLIAYYPFNGNVVDSSGNGNNGTPYNLKSVANRFGTPNSAYCFDGSSSYITVKDNVQLRLNNTDFTFNAWVDLEKYGHTYGSSLITKRISGANNGWLWSISGDLSTPPHVLSYGAGGGSVNAFSNSVVPTQHWHMLTTVYTHNNQQVSFYIDGVLDGRVNNILTPNPTITALMYIGRDNPDSGSDGYFFKGILDDVRIYNRALSANAIQKLFTTAY